MVDDKSNSELNKYFPYLDTDVGEGKIILEHMQYEARKQAQIDLSNQKSLERLEEIDRWISERADNWPQQMPTVQYIEFMSTVTQDEIDAYCQWLDTKLEMLNNGKLR